jgi:hypothetical protein
VLVMCVNGVVVGKLDHGVPRSSRTPVEWERTAERNFGTARLSLTTNNKKWSSRAEPQKERSRFCGKESEGTHG